MPPEYNDNPSVVSLRMSNITFSYDMANVNPDVHEMYYLSMGCYHFGNALHNKPFYP